MTCCQTGRVHGLWGGVACVRDLILFYSHSKQCIRSFSVILGENSFRNKFIVEFQQIKPYRLDQNIFKGDKYEPEIFDYALLNGKKLVKNKMQYQEGHIKGGDELVPPQGTALPLQLTFLASAAFQVCCVLHLFSMGCQPLMFCTVSQIINLKCRILFSK